MVEQLNKEESKDTKQIDSSNLANETIEYSLQKGNLPFGKEA